MGDEKIGKIKATNVVVGPNGTINNYGHQVSHKQVRESLEGLRRVVDENAAELPADVPAQARKAIREVAEDAEGDEPSRYRRLRVRLDRILDQSQRVVAVTNAVAEVEQAIRRIT
jgi:hypothetical protein